MIRWSIAGKCEESFVKSVLKESQPLVRGSSAFAVLLDHSLRRKSLVCLSAFSCLGGGGGGGGLQVCEIYSNPQPARPCDCFSDVPSEVGSQLDVRLQSIRHLVPCLDLLQRLLDVQEEQQSMMDDSGRLEPLPTPIPTVCSSSSSCELTVLSSRCCTAIVDATVWCILHLCLSHSSGCYSVMHSTPLFVSQQWMLQCDAFYTFVCLTAVDATVWCILHLCLSHSSGCYSVMHSTPLFVSQQWMLQCDAFYTFVCLTAVDATVWCILHLCLSHSSGCYMGVQL